MSRIVSWLNSLFFPEMPAERIATLRIAIGLFAFVYIAQRYGMLLDVASTHPSLFQPLGAVWWLSEPLSLAAFQALLVLTLLSNAFAVAGCFYRFSGPLFAVCLLLLLSYRNSWTMIYHNDNAMVLHVLVLGFSSAAEVWSVDSWWRKRSQTGRAAEALSGWRFGWPVQLICAVTVTGYLLSGVAKVVGDLGWNWVSGSALRSQVATDAIRKALLGENVSEMAFHLYEHLWIFTLIGVMSMLVELGAPLALLNRRFGMLWSANAFAMHWGILLVMGITFRYQLLGIVFLSFFPAERLLSASKRVLRRAFPPPPKEPVAAGAWEASR